MYTEKQLINELPLSADPEGRRATAANIAKAHRSTELQMLVARALGKYEASGDRDRLNRTSGSMELQKRFQNLSKGLLPERLKIVTDSVDAVKMIHAAGATRLTKGFPPESSNATSGSSVANTGASNVWRDESDMGNTRTTQATAPHSASIRSTTAGPTQKAADPQGMQACVDKLKAMYAEREQDPNRDDAPRTTHRAKGK